MEVVSSEFLADPNQTTAQFGTVPEPLPNWGLPFCMELRFVFETQQKRYYVLDFGGDATLAEVINDGLPEPTVLFIAAELGLAMESLHELGVSYSELNLGNVTVDNHGHVVLWREFEGKEYWHISECICGLHGVNCGKSAHEVKRRGINVPPGQSHWEEIALGMQDDWRSLGLLLCQMLTGQLDFQNKSLEEVIISLFITVHTKDFLYGLVTGAVQSFEDLKCHPCFHGLDWDEVKSKTLSSPLMATIHPRQNSTTSNRFFSKSPSLQNVYTAGMSARHERGMFMKSPLSRTRSTSELHSSDHARPILSGFERERSGRRNTLSVFHNGRNEPVGTRNDAIKNQGDTMFRGHSKSVGAKSSLSLKRQVLKQNSRGLDRPPCLSAPNSPRQSLDISNYVYPSPVSAPSSLQGSVNAIHSVNSSSSTPITTSPMFNEPETNPFHEGYKKRWGSTSLDTAFGLYSSNLKVAEDSTIPRSVSQFVGTVNTTNPPYGALTRDFQDASQLNNYAVGDGVYSPVLIQNGNSTTPERNGLSMDSRQASAHPFRVPHGYQTRDYSIDVNSGSSEMCYISRNSQNNPGMCGPYFQPYDVPNSDIQKQSRARMSNDNVETRNGMYFSNSQLSPGNVNNMNNVEAVDRTNVYLNVSDEQNQLQEHSLQCRRSSINLDTTDGIHSLRSQVPTNNVPWGMSSSLSQPKDTTSSPNYGLFHKRRGSDSLDNSDGIYSSFFQTSPNNQSGGARIEQSNPKEIANVLFQQHFRSRRGSVECQNSGKVSPNSRNTQDNECGPIQMSPREASGRLRQQTHIRQSGRGIRVANSVNLFPRNKSEHDGYNEATLQQGLSEGTRIHPTEELSSEYEQYGHVLGSTERVLERANCVNSRSNNSTTPRSNSPSQRRNSRSPEPVVAIHLSTLHAPASPIPNLNGVSVIVSHEDTDEFNRFQEQSQRRRSSTDVASLSFQGVPTSTSETPGRKTSLSRSVSYSNMSEGYRSVNDGFGKSESIGQMNCKRSMALRPIPSFEEFRTMRALNKMAYGVESGKAGNQRDKNNNCKDSNKDNDYNSDRQNNSTVSNKSNNNVNGSKSNNNYSDNFAETTTTSPTSNPVIQDLLVKYGLDKSPRSSTLKAYQNSNKRTVTQTTNTPTSPARNHHPESTSSDTTDTKQRLLNILDDFSAVRSKHKTLSTSFSMINVKAVDSYRDQRRPSLPSTLTEENQENKTRDCSAVNDKTLGVQVTRDLPVRFIHPIDSENVENVELCSPKSEEKKSKNPSLVVSNTEGMIRRKKNDTNINKQANSSQKIDKKNYSENPRRKSKKTSTTKKRSPEIQQNQNKLTSPREQAPVITVEDSKSNKDINQSKECMISSSSEVKSKEPEVFQRVSEKARNMTRKHRKSLELVKKTGKNARKERGRSFAQALQNKNKESNSEQDECINQENGSGDIQPVVTLNGPIRGDHSVEIEAPSVDKRDLKYLRLMNRRTSSLLSLTDDLSGDVDEFEPEDMFTNRSGSLSELNEESEKYCNQDSPVGRGDSFLSVKSDTDFPRGQHVSRTESNSSLLSRCSSFHSNYSGDSGSVHLDFEDSDDDLFYLAEPRETHEKSESDIQRNDSGLGDEIGVGSRVKKRWEELGRVSSRQSMIVASWRELATKKEGQDQGKGIAKADIPQEQEQRQRRISHGRRISRERQPNAIDCPDCGRAFLVENDKPNVKSQGPNKSLICYKCQSHRVERKEAIIELVQTEINYSNDFQIIKEEFLSPMQLGGIVSPDNLAKIFLNIQELLDVSKKFCKKIQSSMDECISKNDEELCHMDVGKIFVENVELLQAYELYCSKQPEAISLLESLQKKNDVLRVFLNITCRENPKCRKMDINSFLLAPVQRVTKYPLLLSRIRRATPRWHGDREDLKLAQRKVEEQIAKINSLTKSSEMKAKKFQSNLGTSDSVDSSRLKKLASDVLAWTLDEMQLLMHGQLKVLCSEFGGGQSWTKRALKRSIETHLLFCIRGQNEPINVDSEDDDDLQFPGASEISDASLLLLKRKNNGKYTLFRDEIKLRDCVAYEETEPDSFGVIHMGKETFAFTARTSKDARKWIKYLKLQMINQGKWRRRRNASANIMLKRS